MTGPSKRARSSEINRSHQAVIGGAIVVLAQRTELEPSDARPGDAVRASQTVTFGFVKRGLVTGLAADYVGELCLDPIQIPLFLSMVKAGNA